MSRPNKRIDWYAVNTTDTEFYGLQRKRAFDVYQKLPPSDIIDQWWIKDRDTYNRMWRFPIDKIEPTAQTKLYLVLLTSSNRYDINCYNGLRSLYKHFYKEDPDESISWITKDVIEELAYRSNIIRYAIRNGKKKSEDEPDVFYIECNPYERAPFRNGPRVWKTAQDYVVWIRKHLDMFTIDNIVWEDPPRQDVIKSIPNSKYEFQYPEKYEWYWLTYNYVTEIMPHSKLITREKAIAVKVIDQIEDKTAETQEEKDKNDIDLKKYDVNEDGTVTVQEIQGVTQLTDEQVKKEIEQATEAVDQEEIGVRTGVEIEETSEQNDITEENIFHDPNYNTGQSWIVNLFIKVLSQLGLYTAANMDKLIKWFMTGMMFFRARNTNLDNLLRSTYNTGFLQIKEEQVPEIASEIARLNIIGTIEELLEQTQDVEDVIEKINTFKPPDMTEQLTILTKVNDQIEKLEEKLIHIERTYTRL